MANVTVFKLTQSKDKKTNVLRPNIGKYGVAKVTVTLNDGSVVELGDNTPIFSTTPKKRVAGLVAAGHLTEEQGEARLEKIPSFILAEYDLVVKKTKQ